MLLVVLTAGLVLRVFPGFLGTFPAGWVVFAVAGTPLLLGAACAVWRWRSARAVAREVDALAQTKDRFLTVLELAPGAPDGISTAIRREASAFCSGLRFDRLRSRPPGKRLWLLLLPAFGFAVLEGLQAWRSLHPPAGLEDALTLIAEARRAAVERPPDDRDFEKAAEELAKAETRIKDSADPMREALRALADLERRLAAASDQAAPLEPAAAEDLAEAVQAQHPGLAEALRAGKGAQAAREVEAMDPADLAKALEQAARYRENQQLRELAGQTPGLAQAQLRQMLDPGDNDGKDGRNGRFLTALRDIKNGTSPSAPQDAGGQGEQPGDVPEGGEKPAPARTDHAPPGGSPGSERDLGQGEELAGERDPQKPPDASDEFVAGLQGDGGALVKMLRAPGGDDPGARRAYRSAYAAAAPAAIDAVNQEQIPAGSRILVRKYFESIRPND